MKYIAIALTILLFSACKQKETAEISAPQMEKILQDIHLAEVYSSMLSDTSHRVAEKNMDSLVVYYNDILKHHKVTTEQFKSSLEWYKNNPAELDTLYGRMISSLSEVDAKFPKP
jgi:hypothetical protein